MKRALKQKVQWLLLFVMLIGFTGCPDYSHLRPVPDYKNMTDGPVEETKN